MSGRTKPEKVCVCSVMREHFEHKPIHELSQDAQDTIRTSIDTLTSLLPVGGADEKVSHEAQPKSGSLDWVGWRARFVPHQPMCLLPQLDLVYEECSSYTVDAPERKLILASCYEAIIDMGFGARALDFQFGSRTTYRYLLDFDARIARGMTYRQFITLDDVQYFLFDGETRGFSLLPGDTENREVLVSAQMSANALDSYDSQRVAAAVEWFRQT